MRGYSESDRYQIRLEAGELCQSHLRRIRPLVGEIIGFARETVDEGHRIAKLGRQK